MSDKPPPKRSMTPVDWGAIANPKPPFDEQPASAFDDEKTDRTESDRVAVPQDMPHGEVTLAMVYAELREHRREHYDTRKILEEHGRLLGKVHGHTEEIAALSENVRKLWEASRHAVDAADKLGVKVKKVRSALKVVGVAISEIDDEDEHSAPNGTGP